MNRDNTFFQRCDDDKVACKVSCCFEEPITLLVFERMMLLPGLEVGSEFGGGLKQFRSSVAVIERCWLKVG